MTSGGAAPNVTWDAPAPDAAAAAPARRAVESRDPATGIVWRRYDAMDGLQVDAVVARARSAQRLWSERPLRERIETLNAFHAELFRRRRDVADTISRENGKAIPEALAAEVAVTLDIVHFVSRNAPRLLSADWFTPSSLALWRKRARIEHEPFGVIAVISPWNYPFMLPAGVVLAALVTGNVAVLKPSEFTPSSAALLAELFASAGLPEGVFSVIQGDGVTGASLARADVDKIFFTGSEATGRRVAVACADRLVPYVLELGGSDAAVVLREADVGHAASGILWGRFANGGQTCVAPKRVFVEQDVYPAFMEAMRDRIARLQLSPDAGGNFDVGPLIRPSQHDALLSQLNDAVANGAQIEAQPSLGDGPHRTLAPTLLSNVPPDSRVLREETFGPVLPVLAVRDADEAVERSNDSAYGLSASVWGRDRARALTVARRLRAGTVMINDAGAVAGMSDVPHGG
ncbi:MAG: aldehyde dehydrogenase family protein, partial [Gemmatimonadaceae bacterium]